MAHAVVDLEEVVVVGIVDDVIGKEMYSGPVDVVAPVHDQQCLVTRLVRNGESRSLRSACS